MLSRLIPAPMVRWFAKPYVAGDSIEAALGQAAQLQNQRELLSTLDLLGEGVTTQEEVVHNVTVYEALIDAVADRFGAGSKRPTLSLKPSAFTTGDMDSVREPITRLCERAASKSVGITIDMEERRWTDRTLELSTSLFDRGMDVGTVLQTRLHRTPSDIENLPVGMRVRLVIGIYPEDAEHALTEKRAMKERMLEGARVLLERGLFVEFATHDEEFIQRFVKEVAPIAPERCEVQMLLGVPRVEACKKTRTGTWGTSVPVRLYLPFAIGWDQATAYLRRRMDESPSMIWLVLRNFGQDR